jgi:hypothetical protein
MAVADHLEQAIEELGYREGDGLVEATHRKVSTVRAFVWWDLQSKGDVDAAYFRGAVPLVAFARTRAKEEVAAVHRRLWNLSRVPLLVATTDSDIGVYSCFKAPRSSSDPAAVALRRVTAQGRPSRTLEGFSRVEVEAGHVAARSRTSFSPRERVDQRLLANLRRLRRVLTSGDPDRAVDGLIASSIFMRYLEDRQILSAAHLADVTGYESYATILRAGVEATGDAFSRLGDRFNGDVFGFAADQLNGLDTFHLDTVAAFLEGEDLETGQRTFWPYDFSIIPPELISSIYEQFLEGERRSSGAYYTPRRVVDLILDEVLPWGDPSAPEILDPACGSGIFLTEAFRRIAFAKLVEKEEPLEPRELANLLKRSVFGIDRSETAVRVAAFSLYLALLQELDPERAWRDAKLPKLIGDNLVVADFFDESVLTKRRFDFVVGNPPWNSKLPDQAEKYAKSQGLPVADKQIATVFLWRASEMLKQGGSVAFLMPAKTFLYNKSGTALRMRRHLLDRFALDTVVDLSLLRHRLFQHAVAPAVVVIAAVRDAKSLGAATDDTITHVVPRITPLQASIDGFVLAQDDIHHLPARRMQSHPDAWKIYLWGTHADFNLITHLRETHRSLRAVASDRSWLGGRGFQVEGGDENPTTAIRGLPLIPEEAIRPFAVDSRLVETMEYDLVHRPRDLALYKGPHVVIRRGATGGQIAAALVDGDAVFPDTVIGITAPAGDRDWLKVLVGVLNSSLAAYYHFLTASSLGVERDTIDLAEHLTLPFVEHIHHRDAARAIDAVLAQAGNGEWRTALDQVVFDLYELTDAERQLIRDTLAQALDQFRRGDRSGAFLPPPKRQLKTYARELRATLRAALPQAAVAVQAAGVTAADAVAYVEFQRQGTTVGIGHSILSSRGLLDVVREGESLADEEQSQVTIIQPSILMMRQNTVRLVKPNESQYWTRSRARSDGAEILGQLSDQSP